MSSISILKAAHRFIFILFVSSLLFGCSKSKKDRPKQVIPAKQLPSDSNKKKQKQPTNNNQQNDTDNNSNSNNNTDNTQTDESESEPDNGDSSDNDDHSDSSNDDSSDSHSDNNGDSDADNDADQDEDSNSDSDDNNDSGDNSDKEPSTKNHQLSLMSYNVYNTFDTEHDIDTRKRREGKNGHIQRHKDDEQYLPNAKCEALVEAIKKDCKGRSKEACLQDAEKKLKPCQKVDWTQEKYKMKLQTIKEVFDLRKAEDPKQQYPDIVGFVEVENEKVTQDIAKLLGYENQITSNSYDFRGIDVALMYKKKDGLKFISSKEIRVDRVEKFGTKNCVKGKRPTRPILEAHFEFHGHPLFVYVNHWPSQGGDTPNRVFAAQKLRRVLEDRRRTHSSAHFLALGDFNTLEYENKPNYNCEDKEKPKAERRPAKHRHPFRDVLLKGYRSLPPQMIDVTRESIHQGFPVAPGTYYYRNKWSDLDRFFISKNLLDKSGLEAKLDTFKILNYKEISEVCKPRYCHTGETVPNRYNFHMRPNQEHPGYSDHYPIFMTLEVKSNETKI